MSYKAVVFDLDGTVLDTAEGLAVAVNAARKECGYRGLPLETLISMVGNGARRLIARSIAYDRADGTSAEDIIDSEETQILLNKFRTIYLDICVEYTKPYQGIIALIKNLRDAGLKLAVLSNKDHDATYKLCDFFFHDMLDDIRGHKDGVKHKPDPEPVLKTLDKLGVTPSECVLVGDSEVDIMTARNVGADIISVDWGFKSHDFLLISDANVIVSSVKDLEEHLLI